MLPLVRSFPLKIPKQNGWNCEEWIFQREKLTLVPKDAARASNHAGTCWKFSVKNRMQKRMKLEKRIELNFVELLFGRGRVRRISDYGSQAYQSAKLAIKRTT